MSYTSQFIHLHKQLFEITSSDPVLAFHDKCHWMKNDQAPREYVETGKRSSLTACIGFMLPCIHADIVFHY